MDGYITLSTPLLIKTAMSFEETTMHAGTPTHARRSVGVNSCVTAEDKDTAVSDTVLFMDWEMPYKQRVVPGAQAALEHTLTKSCLSAAWTRNQQPAAHQHHSLFFLPFIAGKRSHAYIQYENKLIQPEEAQRKYIFLIFHEYRYGLNLYILHSASNVWVLRFWK